MQRAGDTMGSHVDLESLPVQRLRDEVLQCRERYMILQAKTGSGKTLCVPTWFADTGRRVLVTEPLREAAIGAATYLAELTGTKLGERVGYAIGGDHEYDSSTRIVFCTDGLARIRDFETDNEFDIWILDEIHEWNVNQSILEAYAWLAIRRDTTAFERVIVMSATMNARELSRARGNASVFQVDGRVFAIEDREPGDSIEADIRELVKAGHDVLVFQPDTEEIEQTRRAIEDTDPVDAEVVCFFKDQRGAEKQRAYAPSARPRVVIATNALETGRTLPPSSAGRTLAVIDSGLEWTSDVRDNVDRLILAPIALSKRDQRRGRTGRVGDGIYIDHCVASPHRRAQYAEPEIRRKRLEGILLEQTALGCDVSTLPLFHPVDERAVARARFDLRRLGLIGDDGQITDLGRAARRLSMLDLEDRVILLRALEWGAGAEALTLVLLRRQRRYPRQFEAARALSEESRSDLLALLDVYAAIHGTRRAEHNDSFEAIRSIDREERARLQYQLAEANKTVPRGTGDRGALRKAIGAGLLCHICTWDDSAKRFVDVLTGEEYDRDPHSLVNPGAELVVGVPHRREDRMTGGARQWLYDVTVVEPAWIMEIASHLVSHEYETIGYDTNSDELVCEIAIRLDQCALQRVVFRGSGRDGIAALRAAIAGSTQYDPDVGLQLATELPDRIRRRVAALRSELRQVDSQRGQSWMVECEFAADGQQLVAEGRYSGELGAGTSVRGCHDEPVTFTTSPVCSWLTEAVAPGQRWICKVSTTVEDIRGRPRIRVMPIIRADRLPDLRIQAERLQAMLDAKMAG